MPVQAVGSPEASPGGSWETIPAGGKGRRSSAGGPRRTPPPQPPPAEAGAPSHAQRAAAAAADPTALKQAALAGHAAAAGAHQHKLAAPLQHDSLASGHQPRQHVRAVPVSAAPVAQAKVILPYECSSSYLTLHLKAIIFLHLLSFHAVWNSNCELCTLFLVPLAAGLGTRLMHCQLPMQAAQHALSPASSLGLSEAQSLGAGSPKLAQTEPLLRNAPSRAASGLGRAFETGPSTSQRDPQIASPHSQVLIQDWAKSGQSSVEWQLVAALLYHKQLVCA